MLRKDQIVPVFLLVVSISVRYFAARTIQIVHKLRSESPNLRVTAGMIAVLVAVFSLNGCDMYTISDSFATHGRKSLKLDHFPSDYPGLRILPEEGMFENKTSIVWDMFNPGEDTLLLHIRIDDRRDGPQYDDRFNTSLKIRPGLSKFRLDFADLITSGTSRLLKRERIAALYFFLHQPERHVVLYYDFLTAL
jgi:hypothetical protein